MAYTQVVATPPAITGAALTYAAAESAGTAVRPGTTLYIKNAGGSPCIVTLNVGRTYNGYTITAPTVTVAAGAETHIGPIPADPFVQTSGTNNGWVLVDYNQVVTVTRVVTT